MIKSEDLIQIGEFAKLAGTNLRTLRYYEERGLLTPALRSEGGFRFYRRSHLDRMATIQRLRDLGLSLKEVAAAIVTDGALPGPELARRLQPGINKQINLTEARIASLQSSLEELQAARSKLAEWCQSCSTPFSAENCDPCQRDGTPMPPALRALL